MEGFFQFIVGKVVEGIRQLLICLGRFLRGLGSLLFRLRTFLSSCGVFELGALVLLGLGSGLFLCLGFLLQGFLLFEIRLVFVPVHLVENRTTDDRDGDQGRCTGMVVDEPLVGLRPLRYHMELLADKNEEFRYGLERRTPPFDGILDGFLVVPDDLHHFLEGLGDAGH